MNQETINNFFQSDLGMQCNSLFSTSDDRVFIRWEEADQHRHGKLDPGTQPLEDQTILEWFEEHSTKHVDQKLKSEDTSEELKNIIAFIEEKAESRGWENAQHMAEQKFGKEKTDEATKNIFGWKNIEDKFSPEQYHHFLSAAIEELEKDHPEFEEEGTTGWDMMRALRQIRDEFDSKPF